jgi:hypothetical protein
VEARLIEAAVSTNVTLQVGRRRAGSAATPAPDLNVPAFASLTDWIMEQ